MNDLSIKSRWELRGPVDARVTRAEYIDELIRDSMFRQWDWVEALDKEAMTEIIAEACHACWRGDYKDDAERLAAIKASLLSFIEPWAEEEADAD